MCLGIPARIIEIKGDTAEVSIGGTIFRAGLQLVENVSPGDYILLHAGFAIEKLSEEQAEETLAILRELGKYDTESPGQ
jgi:hydrogenase expression/formation protein HypC